MSNLMQMSNLIQMDWYNENIGGIIVPGIPIATVPAYPMQSLCLAPELVALQECRLKCRI